MTAPAMPSEEDVARALIAYFVENTGFETFNEDGAKTAVSAYYGGYWIDLRIYPMARAVLALFAPILAEKERLERMPDDDALDAGSKPNVEIRRNNDGSIDEVVATGVSVHLEQMDDHSWYLGLDAPGEVWQFWVTGRAKTKVRIYHEHSTYTPRAAAIRAQGE